MVPTNPYAAEWIKAHAGELCVELSRQQHESVRAIVDRMYREGRRPEEMADQIERVVGLTSRQEQAVENFRQRVLDDTGDEDIADARAGRYADSQLVYRSENIARTENRYAVEQGRRTEWLQARDDGEMPTAAKRAWTSLPKSARLCDACADMDGQEVGLDEDFYSEVLEIYVPCPPLHPSCRCTVTLRFD
jgi:hypothetical protein